jgi:hypothetical protein
LSLTDSEATTLETTVVDTREGHVDTFLDSALYYCLTGRRGGWLYRSPWSSFVVCVHPHVPDRLLVFPEIGARGDYHLTAQVLSTIDRPNNGIQLARYSLDQLASLGKQLTKLGPLSLEITVVPETFMDWRYPIHILDTRRVSALCGSTFMKVRNKIRRAASRGIVVTSLHAQKMISAMESALLLWKRGMGLRNIDTGGMFEFYEELLLAVQNDRFEVRGLCFSEAGRPVGFSVWDGPFRGVANLLVNIADVSITGLSDLQMVSTCKRLHNEGIAHLNVGGSELESLDKFKAKFSPVTTIPALSALLVYCGPKAMARNIEVRPIMPRPVTASLRYTDKFE